MTWYNESNLTSMISLTIVIVLNIALTCVLNKNAENGKNGEQHLMAIHRSQTAMNASIREQ